MPWWKSAGQVAWKLAGPYGIEKAAKKLKEVFTKDKPDPKEITETLEETAQEAKRNPAFGPVRDWWGKANPMKRINDAIRSSGHELLADAEQRAISSGDHLVSKLDESLDRQRVEAEKQVRRSLWLGAYLLTGAGAVLILLAFLLFGVVLPAMHK